MTATKLPAHNYRFYIDTSATDTPDWVQIKGINTWAPSSTDTIADVTDFDSLDGDDNGYSESLPVRRSKSWALSGFYLTDTTTGDRDPGQLAVEAAANRTGYEGVVGFKIEEISTAKTKTTDVVFSGLTSGGGNDAASSWGITAAATAPVVDDTLPALPAAPTSPTGSSATGFTLVTATLVDATVTHWEVEITRSAAVLTTVTATSKPVHVVLTAGSSTARIRARNAAGWGEWSAATSTITTS